MSNRGRGRGGGVKPNDRSSSASSSASSRSPSVTRPTTSATIQDNDRFIKQLTKEFSPGSTPSVNLGANTRVTPKFAVNIAAAKKVTDKTDSTTTTPSSNSNNVTSSMNKTATPNGKESQISHGNDARHRSRNANENYVQTEGIFKGNAQIPIKPTVSSDSRIPSAKRESSGSNIRTPNIKKIGTAKTIVTGDVDGLKYEIDEENEPRQIPIAERKSIFNVKKEPDVIPKTKEPISTNSDHINSFIQLFSHQKLESSTVKDEPVEPTDLPTNTQESNNDTSQLILMQFPDVLPCTRSSSSSTTTKPELASLTDLPDGFLGKLQIYKSGKCRLKLNDDTYLDVDIGQSTSFLQNVMVTEMASSTTTTTTDQSTNNDMNKLVCLGDIKHKLVVSLDVDHVLHDTRQ